MTDGCLLGLSITGSHILVAQQALWKKTTYHRVWPGYHCKCWVAMASSQSLQKDVHKSVWRKGRRRHNREWRVETKVKKSVFWRWEEGSSTWFLGTITTCYISFDTSFKHENKDRDWDLSDCVHLVVFFSFVHQGQASVQESQVQNPWVPRIT